MAQLGQRQVHRRVGIEQLWKRAGVARSPQLCLGVKSWKLCDTHMLVIGDNYKCGYTYAYVYIYVYVIYIHIYNIYVHIYSGSRIHHPGGD
jgi:hypothetical protein